MAARPSFVNQDACNLGFLTHPSVGLFPQNIFTADGFLWLGMSVEDLNLIVQRSFIMNATGAAELWEQLRDASTLDDGSTVCVCL